MLLLHFSVGFTRPFYTHFTKPPAGENYAPFDWLMDSHAPTEESYEGVKSRRAARYAVAKMGGKKE